MKRFLILSVDSTDTFHEDGTLLSVDLDTDDKRKAELKYQELLPVISNVYLVEIIMQTENI